MVFPLWIAGAIVVLGGAFLFLRQADPNKTSLNLSTHSAPPVVQGAPEQAVSAVTPFDVGGLPSGGVFRQQQPFFGSVSPQTVFSSDLPVFSTPISPSDGGFIPSAPPSNGMTEEQRHHCPEGTRWDSQRQRCVPYRPPTPTPTPTPVPIPPGPHHGGSKALEAFFRAIVPDQTWIATWRGILRAGDLARVDPSKNVKLPDQIAPGMIKAAEFVSSDAIVANAARMKGLGISVIGFDFETGAGFGTPADLANPIAAIQKASKAARSAGLRFAVATDKVLGAKLGAQIARYADYVNFQGQGLIPHGGVQAYANYVLPLARGSKQINPNVKVISQVSTRDGQLQQATAAVINDVDIISVWPDTNAVNWQSEITTFGRWFRSTYG